MNFEFAPEGQNKTGRDGIRSGTGIRALMVLAIFVLAMGCSTLLAQEIKVGDRVKTEFGGEMLQGIVTGINRAGWLTVEIAMDEMTAPMTMPRDQFTLVESAKLDMRTWTSTDGQFTVQARALDLKGSTVELEKENGEVIKVPLSKLSKEDNDYVKDVKTGKIVASVAGHEAGSGNRDAGGMESAGGVRGGNNRPGRDPDMAFGGGRVDAPREVLGVAVTPLATGGTKPFASGKYETGIPDWMPRGLSPASIPFDIDLGGAAMHESFSLPVVSPDGKRIAVGVVNRLEDQGKILVFDLASQSVLIEETLSCDELVPLAFSPDGQQLVGALNPGGSIHPALCFWKIDSAKKSLDLEKAWGLDDHPTQGTFLSADRIATQGNSEVNVYEIGSNKRLFQDQGSDILLPIGGAGHALDGSMKGKVFDLAKGTYQTLSNDNSFVFMDARAMDASGRYCLTFKKNYAVRDLTSGKIVAEFSTFSQGGLRAGFVTDKYVMVGGYLFDFERRSPVAELDFGADANPGYLPDGTAVFVHRSSFSERDYRLVVAPLLTPELLAKANEYLSTPEAPIAPGTQIRLDLQGMTGADQQAIQKRVGEAGLSVSSAGPLELVSSLTSEATEEMTVRVRSGNDAGATVKVTFTPTVSKIELRMNGKVLWSRHRRNGPTGSMQGQQGETPQSTADRLCRPPEGFFANAIVPSLVNLHEGKLPSFSVSGNGLEAK